MLLLSRLGFWGKFVPLCCILLITLIVIRLGFWWGTHSHHLSCVSASTSELSVKVIRDLRRTRDHHSFIGRVISEHSQVSQGCGSWVGHSIKLSDNNLSGLVQGQVFKAQLKLKPVRGTHNPPLFSYERWARGQSIVATGYITKLLSPTEPSDPLPIGASVRLFQGIIQALSNGNRSMIPQSQWAVFQSTGTVHLVVISGLHVGMYSLIIGSIMRLIWGGLTLLGLLGEESATRFPSRKFALIFVLVGIWLLVINTGMQPPVLRAGLTATLGIVLLVMGVRITSSLWAWLFAFSALVIWEPGFVFRSGFWLSFVAVLIFILYMAIAIKPGRVSRLWRSIAVQFVLCFGMFAWVGFFNATVSVVGPAANLFSIPLISFITLPLILGSAVLGQADGVLGENAAAWGEQLTHLADFSIWCLYQYLSWLDALQPKSWKMADFSLCQFTIFAMAGMLFVIPGLARQKLILVIVVAVNYLHTDQTPLAPGEFFVHVLDVGQGSSALVATEHTKLLVDVGPAAANLQDGFDTGKSIVTPYLRRTGGAELRRILLTHLDLDHAGGLATVSRLWPSADIFGLTSCPAGAEWEWDGVRFRILQDEFAISDNDRSCTLLVQGNSGTAYFSGDISKAVERRLIHHLPKQIDLLIGPHHGAATSSGWPFVVWLKPSFTVFSAGANNRYQHPRNDIVSRYQVIGSRVLTTSEQGSISWRSQRPNRICTSREGCLNREN
ncbi:MAG: DNA internalization-related competence protein ComEC/Rec2 [Pseudomonadota bacterium]